MSERYTIITSSVVDKLELLLKNSKYLDYSNTYTKGRIKESKKLVKELKDKLESGDIDL